MKKNKRLFILLTLYFSISQIDAQTPLSFEESLHLLNQGNQSLKIADKSTDLSDANLRGADLRRANLYDADLRDADLRDEIGRAHV